MFIKIEKKKLYIHVSFSASHYQHLSQLSQSLKGRFLRPAHIYLPQWEYVVGSLRQMGTQVLQIAGVKFREWALLKANMRARSIFCRIKPWKRAVSTFLIFWQVAIGKLCRRFISHSSGSATQQSKISRHIKIINMVLRTLKRILGLMEMPLFSKLSA